MMLEIVGHFLEQSPLLALFAAIGLGYGLGRISIAGFSLGVGAVLFAGLALGALAPKSAPPALVGSIGLSCSCTESASSTASSSSPASRDRD
jgi:putative transport protein